MRVRGAGGWAFLVAVAILTLSMPGSAAAATVVNGGFESGTLNGWHVHQATGLGDWFAYKGTDAPIGSKKNKQIPAGPVQAPPQGAFAAVTDETNPDTLILYQDVALEAGRSQWLSLLAYYNSTKPIAIPAPDTLSIDDGILGTKKNQQYRIDVMRPDAPLESLDPADILRTVFQTQSGDPQSMPPTRFTADLTPFAGQTVRIRIANAVHEEVFNAGVDDVSISNTPPGQSPSRNSKHGSGLFGFGKIKLNRHNGTATLRVRVPGPGRLTAKGVPVSVRTAGAHASRKLRKPIKPVAVRVASAKTVTIPLKPTPPARAILRKQHHLRVKVAVTYAPVSGSPEGGSVPVVLRLEPSSPSRR